MIVAVQHEPDAVSSEYPGQGGGIDQSLMGGTVARRRVVLLSRRSRSIENWELSIQNFPNAMFNS